jgi:hypothetical protein
MRLATCWQAEMMDFQGNSDVIQRYLIEPQREMRYLARIGFKINVQDWMENCEYECLWTWNWWTVRYLTLPASLILPDLFVKKSESHEKINDDRISYRLFRDSKLSNSRFGLWWYLVILKPGKSESSCFDISRIQWLDHVLFPVSSHSSRFPSNFVIISISPALVRVLWTSFALIWSDLKCFDFARIILCQIPVRLHHRRISTFFDSWTSHDVLQIGRNSCIFMSLITFRWNLWNLHFLRFWCCNTWSSSQSNHEDIDFTVVRQWKVQLNSHKKLPKIQVFRKHQYTDYNRKLPLEELDRLDRLEDLADWKIWQIGRFGRFGRLDRFERNDEEKPTTKAQNLNNFLSIQNLK